MEGQKIHVEDEDRRGNVNQNMRKIIGTFGKISARTCTARLEFQPEYPRRITSAYVISRCKVKLIENPMCTQKHIK